MSKDLEALLIAILFLLAILVLPASVILSKLGQPFGQLAEMFPAGPYPSNPPASQPPASQPPASQPPPPPSSGSPTPNNICTGITPKTPTGQRGQTLTFTCTGTVEDQDHVADFRVKYRAYGSSTFNDVTLKSKIANTGTTANAKFVYSYPVPDSALNGDYLVECRICNPSQSECTVWGKAQ